MVNLLLIPHPSKQELLISTELLLYGLMLRWMLHKLQTAARRERKWLIRQHVTLGHSRWFADCQPCATRMNQDQQDLLLEPEGSQPQVL